MKKSKLLWSWLILFLWISYEYLILNKWFHGPSFYRFIIHTIKIPAIFLDPKPGYPLSYWLGWIGFGFILLTNLYILRKRLSNFQNVGKSANWLDFHIFCGLFGPTLILFHTNFFLEGIAAISFWSMVLSVISGLVGRFLYTKILKRNSPNVGYYKKLLSYWHNIHVPVAILMYALAVIHILVELLFRVPPSDSTLYK